MSALYTLSGNKDTICAISTPPGMGAISVIRVSGPGTFSILNSLFSPSAMRFRLDDAAAYTILHGDLKWDGEVIDEVLLSLFRAPHSYTGEDVIEISSHGSKYIQQRILEVLIGSGARLALAGEFTLRAFINGKYDLVQSEAIADLIASNSRSSQQLAFRQMRGGFSGKIKHLRHQLVDFASLLELELDFSEEDVEFADRTKMSALLLDILEELRSLRESYKLGNVIRQGIPVAIIGKPNVGKSTLLNSLLNDERAIVSDIPGTTRDTVEDSLTLNGITFRFIDTAGLRAHSEDIIENIGIGKTYEKIAEARVILYVFDISTITSEEIDQLTEEFSEHINDPDKHFILVGNKADLMVEAPAHIASLLNIETIFISAKRKDNINLITDSLLHAIAADTISDHAILSNVRHFESVNKTIEMVESVQAGLQNEVSADLLAIDIHAALYHLGQISGEVTTDEILGNIFSKFCIGK